MKYQAGVTVLDTKLYPELQEQYCMDPKAGRCPCYHPGDTYLFRRDEENDHFRHMGLNTLIQTDYDPDTTAGGPKMPHCSEAWDAVSRYIWRVHYERVDEGREYYDHLLFRRNEACDL